jgi:hypothetical protein
MCISVNGEEETIESSCKIKKLIVPVLSKVVVIFCSTNILDIISLLCSEVQSINPINFNMS